MRDIVQRLASIVLVSVVLGCAPSTGEVNRSGLHAAKRVQSSTGFSFLPPKGSSWTEEFGRNEILYLKRTNNEVSFYAGALEGRITSSLEDKDALIAWVRSKKDQWASDGRYSNTSSSFHIESQQNSCVRYSLSANDHGAPEEGRHDHLLMRAVGRFCMHPEDRGVAVDIYYSARHAPDVDVRSLLAEGEEFLDSLQFMEIPSGSKN